MKILYSILAFSLLVTTAFGMEMEGDDAKYVHRKDLNQLARQLLQTTNPSEIRQIQRQALSIKNDANESGNQQMARRAKSLAIRAENRLMHLPTAAPVLVPQ